MIGETKLMQSFDDILGALHQIQNDNCSNENCECAIKDGLNKFFTDMRCNEVKYTVNTDKEFFGIVIKRYFNYLERKYIVNGSQYDQGRPEYMVELDSKLVERLTPNEILALLIYEINHICSKSGLEKCQNIFYYYSMKSGISMNHENFLKYPSLFTMVAEETIRVINSVFDKMYYELVLPDDVIRAYGLSDAFDSALEKVKLTHSQMFAGEMQPNLVILQWYFNIMDELYDMEKSIIYTLRKTVEYIGSTYIKKSILEAVKQLGDKFESSSERKYKALTESSKEKRSLFSQMKFNGLRSLEEDVYEYNMRIKNIETENDAILLMRQINARLQMLEDYLLNEDLSEKERKRWSSLLDKYTRLRDELSRKTVYKQKMYGLFVDYNALQKMYDNGGFNVI